MRQTDLTEGEYYAYHERKVKLIRKGEIGRYSNRRDHSLVEFSEPVSLTWRGDEKTLHNVANRDLYPLADLEAKLAKRAERQRVEAEWTRRAEALGAVLGLPVTDTWRDAKEGIRHTGGDSISVDIETLENALERLLKETSK